MQIGGIDSPVVKRQVLANPGNGEIVYEGGRKITEPYIPGSSIKGKMRSLLENSLGLLRVQMLLDGKPINDKKNFTVGGSVDSNFVLCIEKNYTMEDKALILSKARLIIRLFGESGGNDPTPGEVAVTRVLFRDCFITPFMRKQFMEGKISLSEEKSENNINRTSGIAVAPRFFERVPAGVAFDFELILRVFDEDKTTIDMHKNTLFLGMKLIELDALGGSGSRGYGRIGFGEGYCDQSIEELLKMIEDALSQGA